MYLYIFAMERNGLLRAGRRAELFQDVALAATCADCSHEGQERFSFGIRAKKDFVFFGECGDPKEKNKGKKMFLVNYKQKNIWEVIPAVIEGLLSSTPELIETKRALEVPKFLTTGIESVEDFESEKILFQAPKEAQESDEALMIRSMSPKNKDKVGPELIRGARSALWMKEADIFWIDILHDDKTLRAAERFGIQNLNYCVVITRSELIYDQEDAEQFLGGLSGSLEIFLKMAFTHRESLERFIAKDALEDFKCIDAHKFRKKVEEEGRKNFPFFDEEDVTQQIKREFGDIIAKEKIRAECALSKKIWIHSFGSEELKKGVALGHPMQERYIYERILQETGYEASPSKRKRITVVDSPSHESLEAAWNLRKAGYKEIKAIKVFREKGEHLLLQAHWAEEGIIIYLPQEED